MLKIKKSKGFTLIELMIVVAIIGILAAVAIPKFADLVTKSKEASVKGGLGALRSAVSIYYGDMEGVYPNSLFAALTNGNKYMPAVANTPSLGALSIPRQTSSSAGTNPGHTTGATGVQSGDVAEATTVALVIAAGEDVIGYATGDGTVLINCSHNDTKGNRWTSY
jgi:prepilin-type N-terminal cleavage/methylation domain-containing protein